MTVSLNHDDIDGVSDWRDQTSCRSEGWWDQTRLDQRGRRDLARHREAAAGQAAPKLATMCVDEGLESRTLPPEFVTVW